MKVQFNEAVFNAIKAATADLRERITELEAKLAECKELCGEAANEFRWVQEIDRARDISSNTFDDLISRLEAASGKEEK